MKKEEFLKQFPKELEYEVSKLYSYFEFSKYNESIMYTEEFYTPNIWKKLTKKIENIKIITCGIFDDSDRRQIAFLPLDTYHSMYLDENDDIDLNKNIKKLNFPYKLLKICVNDKFNKYRHKDYLGSIMGLNIKRELLGDLILSRENAYIAVSEKISHYILSELKQVGKSICTVEEIDIDSENLILPKYEYKDKIITVSSIRLDSVVSEIINISRNKIIEPIKKGKILLDYYEEKDKSKIIEAGSVITIKGYGKYKLFAECGETKKGKKRILIKEYV